MVENTTFRAFTDLLFFVARFSSSFLFFSFFLSPISSIFVERLGVIITETSKGTEIVMIIVVGIVDTNAPSIPGRIAKGKNAAIVVMVAAITGYPT